MHDPRTLNPPDPIPTQQLHQGEQRHCLDARENTKKERWKVCNGPAGTMKFAAWPHHGYWPDIW